jgi:hypothetical protein
MASAKELVKRNWLSQDEFDRCVRKACVSQHKLIVPTLVEGFLRIKIINQNEFSAIRRGIHNGIPFEEVTPDWDNDMYFFFGKEPFHMAHPMPYGLLVSSWKQDKHVTQRQLSYSFAKAAIHVFGAGYGSRGVSESIGLNIYVNAKGRGTNRPHPSPLIADEDIGHHQYFNMKQGNDLLNPYIRSTIRSLLQGIFQVACKHNPEFMSLVGPSCSRGILTTGSIPKPSTDELTTHYSTTPPLAFGSGSHVDIKDKLPRGRSLKWQGISDNKKWNHCLRILSETDSLCLPTTCGYQFCFADGQVAANLEVRAFFSMEGLGLAVKLQDGISHHFMATAFSHHTCLAMIQSDNKVSCSNSDDAFLIVAWGASGAERDVSDSDTNNQIVQLLS